MFCLNLYITFIALLSRVTMNELNKVDVKICKVSHAGLSYTGTVKKTYLGSRCRRWETLKLHKALNNEDFPEGSIRKAENYCRNPTKHENGPWCYITGAPSYTKQRCIVPLCANQCQITGPGMEYAGNMSEATFKKCENWNNNWHKRRVKAPNGIETFGIVHSTDKFPDKNLDSASNYCRNPDGSLGGPWCYTKSDKKGVFVKSYCDVPVCYEKTNEFISKQRDVYSHFVSCDSSETNITFSVRLWNPDQEHNASLKILLSLLNTPMSKENIQKWGTAIELTIANYGASGVVNESMITNILLKATEYTSFVVSWQNGVINLYTSSDATKSVYIESLADSPILKHGIDGNFGIRYYSVSGDVASWAVSPYDHDTCQEHTTFLPSPLFVWKLPQNGVEFYLELFVRSFHSALIFFTPDPYHDFPRLFIKVGFPNFVTEVVYEPTEMEQSMIASTNFSISYWTWTQLRITLLGKKMRIMRYTEGSFLSLLTSSHEIVSSMKWFSIGSNESLSHWALFCEPLDITTAYPPNCALTDAALDYQGDQSVSQSGLPCLPWFVVEPRIQEDASDLNYCRNNIIVRSGPWCYVQAGNTIKPEICNVRKCNAVICKKAGTANDYVGDLAVSRSNFTCKHWPRSYYKSRQYEMYPSTYLERNYCRNPTRNVGGAWCFTTDPVIKKDLCDVKDCDKSESRIVIITKQKENLKHTYILPAWRGSGLCFSLKRWDPSLSDGALFKIFSLNKSKILALYIGADYNEELILSFEDTKTNTTVLLVRKIFPHIIPGARWREFRLKMYTGGIRLGYDTKNYTILDWTTDNPLMIFNPSFISYGSIGANVIGVYFPQLECHIENTSALEHSSIYPICWQREHEFSTNLTIYLRGSGVAIIPLIHYPSQTENYLVVFIDDEQIYLENNTVFNAIKLCTAKGQDLMSNSKWNRYDIFSKNNSLFINRNEVQLIKWDAPSAPVYYFFSIAVRRGWVVWTSNCPPQDIDSPLQDGGWSDWSNWECSVSCGKGVGHRKRECNSPKPTIFGKACAGSSEETGVCNNFECDNIFPETYNLLRKDLRTKCFNIIAQEGEDVTFTSPLRLIERIKTESPTSDIIWLYNGTILKSKERKHFIHDSFAVTVKNISQDENGVYTCVAKNNMGVNTLIKVLVIAVEPLRPDIVIHNGSSFDLTCTSDLATIYADLWIKWYLNDVLFSATDIATTYFKNTLRITLALKNHSGIWKCVMEQTDLNLRWVVQMHKVCVKEEPSLWTRFLQSYIPIVLTNLNADDCDYKCRCESHNKKIKSRLAAVVIFIIVALVGIIIYMRCLIKCIDTKITSTEDICTLRTTATACEDLQISKDTETQTEKEIHKSRYRICVKSEKLKGFKFNYFKQGKSKNVHDDDNEDTKPSNAEVGEICTCPLCNTDQYVNKGVQSRDAESHLVRSVSSICTCSDNDDDDFDEYVRRKKYVKSRTRRSSMYRYKYYDDEDEYDDDCDEKTCLYRKYKK